MTGEQLEKVAGAFGLTGKETPLEMAKMHVTAHSVRMRQIAEQKGLQAARDEWNASWPSTDDTLCSIIENAPKPDRPALEYLYDNYIEAMHNELAIEEDEKSGEPDYGVEEKFDWPEPPRCRVEEVIEECLPPLEVPSSDEDEPLALTRQISSAFALA
jgi:hypothetical protein